MRNPPADDEDPTLDKMRFWAQLIAADPTHVARPAIVRMLARGVMHHLFGEPLAPASVPVATPAGLPPSPPAPAGPRSRTATIPLPPPPTGPTQAAIPTVQMRPPAPSPIVDAIRHIGQHTRLRTPTPPAAPPTTLDLGLGPAGRPGRLGAPQPPRPARKPIEPKDRLRDSVSSEYGRAFVDRTDGVPEAALANDAIPDDSLDDSSTTPLETDPGGRRPSHSLHATMTIDTLSGSVK